jgi:hypothetical protein
VQDLAGLRVFGQVEIQAGYRHGDGNAANQADRTGPPKITGQEAAEDPSDRDGMAMIVGENDPPPACDRFLIRPAGQGSYVQ